MIEHEMLDAALTVLMDRLTSNPLLLRRDKRSPRNMNFVSCKIGKERLSFTHYGSGVQMAILRLEGSGGVFLDIDTNEMYTNFVFQSGYIEHHSAAVVRCRRVFKTIWDAGIRATGLDLQLTPEMFSPARLSKAPGKVTSPLEPLDLTVKAKKL